jgi:crotonobetainyl-CoA:carnitine CoA-transferase CaiB-like acyl-CoA transferase
VPKLAAHGVAVLRILDGCDVLTSTARPEALTRLWVVAASTHATRPRLIHCALPAAPRANPRDCCQINVGHGRAAEAL